MADLEDEASRATEMLAGKAVRQVWRHRSGEVVIEFADRSRLFADARGGDIELSITAGEDSAGAPR